MKTWIILSKLSQIVKMQSCPQYSYPLSIGSSTDDTFFNCFDMDVDNDLIYALGSTRDFSFSGEGAFRPLFFKYHEASAEIYQFKIYNGHFITGLDLAEFSGCKLADDNANLAFSTNAYFSMGLLDTEDGEISKQYII